jgi:hypothetical protein
MSFLDHPPHHTFITPFEVAKDFVGRLKQHHATLQTLRDHGEKWPKGLGLYQDADHSLINQLQLSVESLRKLNSRAIEPPTFHDHLVKFVEKINNTKPKSHPLIILDLGGGAGITWSNAAYHFRREINQGRMAFVVTNLNWSPQQFLAEGRKQTDKRVQINAEGLRLVQYINSTFGELPTRSIALANGNAVTLRGNVDLVHESRSLTSWSHIPEVDIQSVQELLSPYASYFIAPQNSPLSYGDRTNQNQREIAIRSSHASLQRVHGLRQVPKVEAGTFRGMGLLYTIFRKQAAPRIEI